MIKSTYLNTSLKKIRFNFFRFDCCKLYTGLKLSKKRTRKKKGRVYPLAVSRIQHFSFCGNKGFKHKLKQAIQLGPRTPARDAQALWREPTWFKKLKHVVKPIALKSSNDFRDEAFQKSLVEQLINKIKTNYFALPFRYRLSFKLFQKSSNAREQVESLRRRMLLSLLVPGASSKPRVTQSVLSPSASRIALAPKVLAKRISLSAFSVDLRVQRARRYVSTYYAFGRNPSSGLTDKLGYYLVYCLKTSQFYIGATTHVAQRKGDHHRDFKLWVNQSTNDRRSRLPHGIKKCMTQHQCQIEDFVFMPLMLFTKTQIGPGALSLTNEQVEELLTTIEKQVIYYFKKHPMFKKRVLNVQTGSRFLPGNRYGGSPQSGIPMRPVAETTGEFAWESALLCARCFGIAPKTIRNRMKGNAIAFRYIEPETFANWPTESQITSENWRAFDFKKEGGLGRSNPIKLSVVRLQ